MPEDIEERMRRLQAEVDEQFEKVKASTDAVRKASDGKPAKEKTESRKELEEATEDLGAEVKKNLVVRVASGQLQKLGTKKAVVVAAGTLLVVWLILKNIGVILFGAVGLGVLYYLLDRWLGEEGKSGAAKEPSEDEGAEDKTD